MGVHNPRKSFSTSSVAIPNKKYKESDKPPKQGGPIPVGPAGYIALALRGWLDRGGVQTLYITPGSPSETSYCESFNIRLRDEFLNREGFASELEARVLSAEWRRSYNEARPHSALGDQMPAEFAARCRVPVGAPPYPSQESVPSRPEPNLS